MQAALRVHHVHFAIILYWAYITSKTLPRLLQISEGPSQYWVFLLDTEQSLVCSMEVHSTLGHLGDWEDKAVVTKGTLGKCSSTP